MSHFSIEYFSLKGNIKRTFHVLCKIIPLTAIGDYGEEDKKNN